MIVPDEIRKCVVFVGYRLPNGEMSLQGTAFFTIRQIDITGFDVGFVHLVTAAHVIQNISKKDNFDGAILLRANMKDGTASIIETDVNAWRFHPTETEVDVAVLPFAGPLTEMTDAKVIPYSMFFNDEIREREVIGLGDEVFLTGLFVNHYGRQRNIPIVRAGNIAALPEEKVYSRFGIFDAYLIEARSIGGLSGSPVFLHLGFDRKFEKDKLLMGTGQRLGTYFLLGLMHGHYKAPLPSDDQLALTDAALLEEEAVNMGIAIVVPSEKILETLEQPMIREQENMIEKRDREQMAAIPDSVDEKPKLIEVEMDFDALEKASQVVEKPDSETK